MDVVNMYIVPFFYFFEKPKSYERLFLLLGCDCLAALARKCHDFVTRIICMERMKSLIFAAERS